MKPDGMKCHLYLKVHIYIYISSATTPWTPDSYLELPTNHHLLEDSYIIQTLQINSPTPLPRALYACSPTVFPISSVPVARPENPPYSCFFLTTPSANTTEVYLESCRFFPHWLCSLYFTLHHCFPGWLKPPLKLFLTYSPLPPAFYSSLNSQSKPL